nr:hypothetical protein [Tanacetum cinerariifolium]
MKKQPKKKKKEKRLAVLFEIALSKAKQIKLATKRSKKDFHISHESGSGDGVDTQSKDLDEQEQKTSCTDEGTDQTKYKEDDDNERVTTPSDDTKMTDEEKLYGEETIDDEVIKELYDDVNVNLGNYDTKMTDANQGGSEQQNVSQELGFEQEEEDAHVTLTSVPEAQKADKPVQSSYVSFDFRSKFLNIKNPSATVNEIASLMETSAPHVTTVPEITSCFTITTPPPPPFFNSLIQQQTLTFTIITSTNLTVTLPEIPNFASIFKFDQRVFALESKMSEVKKTNQFDEAVSSISGIVDKCLASKMKEVVNVVVKLQTNKLREEAKAEN